MPRRRAAPEKVEESKGRKLMTFLGFDTWHLSQARASKQTPGLPDCFFTCPARGMIVAWEAKSLTGKQSAAQQKFEQHWRAAGKDYVCGTVEALAAWCETQGLVRVLPSGAWEIHREGQR